MSQLQQRLPSLGQIRAEWARRSLLRFTQHTHAEYKTGWFHREVAGELDKFLADVQAKRSPRLILTAPPQHGKSELVSRRFPAYAYGHNPNLRIIATSYADNLANRFSQDVQRIVDSPKYHEIFPDTRIVGEFAKAGSATRNIRLWEIVGRRGSYLSAGVGSGITGNPADILLVDDPIKDEEEARSETIRENVWNWLTTVAMTRVQEGGGIAVMMTRWHEDDPVGRLTARFPERWKVLNFPALAEHDEPFRKIGEPLSVERFSLPTLLDLKTAVGPYGWSALYQQHPTPLEGGIIKRDWIKFYIQLPASFDEVIQSWDMAFKDTKTADFVAGHVWARKGADYYLLDREHGRMDCPASMKAVRRVSEHWPEATAKYIEDKANGPAVISLMRHELNGMIPVEPEGGKDSRMYAVSPLFAAGNVHVPHPDLKPWVNDVIAEWTAFPNAAHDDDCDAMSQALVKLAIRASGALGYWKRRAAEVPAKGYMPVGAIKCEQCHQVNTVGQIEAKQFCCDIFRGRFNRGEITIS